MSKYNDYDEAFPEIIKNNNFVDAENGQFTIGYQDGFEGIATLEDNLFGVFVMFPAELFKTILEKEINDRVEKKLFSMLKENKNENNTY